MRTQTQKERRDREIKTETEEGQRDKREKETEKWETLGNGRAIVKWIHARSTWFC